MYGGFDDLDREVQDLAQGLEPCRPIEPVVQPVAQDLLDRGTSWTARARSGADTPMFGADTITVAHGIEEEFGPGRVLVAKYLTEEFPCWPSYSICGGSVYEVLAGAVRQMPFPVEADMIDPAKRPARIQRNQGGGDRGSSGSWVIHWPVLIRFENGQCKKSMTFTDSTFGEGGRAGENPVRTCRDAAWDYFKTVFEWSRQARIEGYGPITHKSGERHYHGTHEAREFKVHAWEAGMNTFGFRSFHYDTETFLLPAQFCVNCEARGHTARTQIWACKGHLDSEVGEVRGEVSYGGSSGSGVARGRDAVEPSEHQGDLPESPQAGEVPPRGAADEGLNVPGRLGGVTTGTDPLVPLPSGPEYSVEETVEMLRRANAEATGSSLYGRPKPARMGPRRAVESVPKTELIGGKSPQFLHGTLHCETRRFPESFTLRGTWPSGPPVEQIRRRVVTEEATGIVLSDQIFVVHNPTFDWCASLSTVGIDDDRGRDILVTLWYLEPPPRPDPALPSLDPFERPERPPPAEVMRDVPRDGTGQMDRDLRSRERFLTLGDEVKEVAQSWVERMKLREMQVGGYLLRAVHGHLGERR